MTWTLDRLRESALPRHLDRALGAPLLWMLGALRSTRSVPGEMSRVGIMVFETIGDTLLAATIIASLRASFPALEITVFGSRGNAGALALVDGIDRIVEVPLMQPAAAVRAVRSVEVDVMIDIGQWPRWYAVLCALSRSRCTIGFATPGQARHFAFDRVVPHRADVHEVENFQALLQPFGDIVRVGPGRALKPVGPASAALVPQGPYVVFHPWAGGFNAQAREWPMARWAELARRLASSGYAVRISGGNADRTRAAELVSACDAACDIQSIAGQCDIPTLASVLLQASAAVCVNTGVMHLAALLDVPLVALHGPTSRRRWGPVGSKTMALAPTGADCEFLNLGFEYPARAVDCMQRIEVEEVLAALTRLLAKKNESHAAAAC